MPKLQVCLETPEWHHPDKSQVWPVVEDAWMYEGCGNTRILVPAESVEDAREQYLGMIKENSWGSRDMFYFETGIVYLDSVPVALISYNGKVWDVRGKDLRDWKSHIEVQKDDLESVLS